MIILPRQAPDKHRESTQTIVSFSCNSRHNGKRRRCAERASARSGERANALSPDFLVRNDHLPGQAWDKCKDIVFKTKRRFSQALGDLRIDHLPSIAGGAAAASDIRFTKRVPLQSGGSWDVPAVAVALFDQNATWHDAADVYGDGWARTWMPQPSFPAWQRMQVRQQLPPPPHF